MTDGVPTWREETIMRNYFHKYTLDNVIKTQLVHFVLPPLQWAAGDETTSFGRTPSLPLRGARRLHEVRKKESVVTRCAHFDNRQLKRASSLSPLPQHRRHHITIMMGGCLIWNKLVCVKTLLGDAFKRSNNMRVPRIHTNFRYSRLRGPDFVIPPIYW